MKMHK